MELRLVPINSIRVLPNRGRKEFTRITELAESIKTKGLINPILCLEKPESPGLFFIVAGERRYRASILAGLKEVTITTRESISPLEAKILELEENVCRQDLSWQEEAELHRQIDELKRVQQPNWTQKDTAELVQLTPGHISKQIEMARRLREDPSLKEKIRNLPMAAAMKVVESHDQAQRLERLTASGKLTITTDLRLGNCLDLIRDLPAASVDLLLTDPPYGLEELEDLRVGSNDKMSGHRLMSETHNMALDDVLALLGRLGPELYRVMKPGAHFYVFSSFQHIGAFIKALAPLEFQPPVLVWDRGKPTTPGYGYNYLNRTEAIIYGHNPPRSKRLQRNMYNVLEHPEVPRNLRVYPTEKPQSLLKDLIAQSTNAGELVLDLFAGSASTLKACRTLGRRSIGFEIDHDAWRRAQLSLSSESSSDSNLPLLDPLDHPESNSRFSVSPQRR